jgi:hypothetical protein
MSPTHKTPKPGRSNVEVDQSGKIERTQEDTVLAFSNNHSYVIRIPATVKRRMLLHLRQQPKHTRNKKAMYMRLFVAGLYLLLKDHLNSLANVIIDTEYTGSEADIRSMLLSLIWRSDPNYPEARIVFQQVGKKSPAHVLAWAVHGKKRPADYVVQEEELLNLLSKTD